MVELNKIPGHCRAFPINTRYRFFSANQETFTKVDHILRHKTWSQQIQENPPCCLTTNGIRFNLNRKEITKTYKYGNIAYYLVMNRSLNK